MGPLPPRRPFLMPGNEEGAKALASAAGTGVTIDEAIGALKATLGLVYPYPRTPFEEWCMESEPRMLYGEWLTRGVPLECERYAPKEMNRLLKENLLRDDPAEFLRLASQGTDSTGPR